MMILVLIKRLRAENAAFMCDELLDCVVENSLTRHISYG